MLINFIYRLSVRKTLRVVVSIIQMTTLNLFFNNLKMKATITYVRKFNNLHIPAKLGLARFCLQGLSGIYCFRHITSGKIYVGQAVDLSVRIMEHINGRHSNIHLQRAIKKHGLDTFF